MLQHLAGRLFYKQLGEEAPLGCPALTWRNSSHFFEYKILLKPPAKRGHGAEKAAQEKEKPALNLPPWANSGIFTQDSWRGNFVRTLLMWKSFYLLKFHIIGFGLQLREHFPKSFKGGGGIRWWC